MGDDKAPQLIVENRAVIIDYATPRSDHPSSSVEIARRGISGGGGEASAKSDWLCDTVRSPSTLCYISLLTVFVTVWMSKLCPQR